VRSSTLTISVTLDRTRALSQLRSEDEHERLLAARALLLTAVAADTPAITRAAANERVVWVRDALDQVLTRLTRVSPAPETLSVPLLTPALAAALRTVTAELLHEIRPVVGLVRLAATQEVGERFAESKTRRRLDRLGQLMSGIEQLHQATAPAKPQEIDLLAEAQAAVDATDSRGVAITIAGVGGVRLLTDPTLLALVLRNALENAVDAVLDRGNAEDRKVVINWGRTDRDVWLSILDDGLGVDGVANAFAVGATTKDGHIGYGLAVVDAASTSLGASVELKNRREGGCTFTIRIALKA
jgi:signal transduction histidine kinase